MTFTTDMLIWGFGVAALSGQMWASHRSHAHRLDRHEKKLDQINGTVGTHTADISAIKATCKARLETRGC